MTATPPSNVRPAWLDQTLYPFGARYLDTGAGQLHYLDEGEGHPLVMVHGTPTWSFMYRHFVRELSAQYRCVVPDHLGFGLSDNPHQWPYTPQAHAANLDLLIRELGLSDITLVVHDFGGPIGLSYALNYPENVRALVIMNTWLWSNADNRTAVFASRLFGSALGRVLYEKFNFSPKILLPQAFADKKSLKEEVHRHYLAPFSTPHERHATWVLACELTRANAWYDSLWQRRGVIADKPKLMLWGEHDPLIGKAQLDRWRSLVDERQIHGLGSGHFVPEEAWQDAVPLIREFLADAYR